MSLFSKATPPYKSISFAELSQLPRAARLIDVREPSEFAEDHLPQAESFPLGGLARSAEAWDKKEPLVLICRSGGRSSRGCQELVALGFEDVSNLIGGMMAVRSK
jgi:rhodanese-related sulfurtransferase